MKPMKMTSSSTAEVLEWAGPNKKHLLQETDQQTFSSFSEAFD
jgi:hypothetical protein